MRVALVVNMTRSSPEANLAAMKDSICQAADGGADLVLFPEAALTGLINNDDPEHDLPLGEAVPGPVTDSLGAVARGRSVYVAAGMLERDGSCLYDSAVLLGPSGELELHYRRIQPQWHGRGADPTVYRQGHELSSVPTSFGTMAFLICGDLFDDSIVERLRELGPDYVLFPFARSFRDGSFDQETWDGAEEPEYVARAALLGCTTLMVNQLEDPAVAEYPSFGGALVVSATDEVTARWALGKPGILYTEA